MKTKTSLPTAILTFASTGIFGPHRAAVDYEAVRTTSLAPRLFLKPKPVAH